MICSHCGKSKEAVLFTKTNLGKKGTGLCKECKAQFDKDYRTKKEKRMSSLPYFELESDLIKREKRGARVGVMVLSPITDRMTSKKKEYLDLSNFGLNAILSELKEPFEYCEPKNINDYEMILVSLTSVMDVENLIFNMEKYAPIPVIPKIIIGGFGCLNINLLVPYIDVACFGRCEGQINEILAGMRFKNVWRKADDPGLEGKYVIRQPRYLVKGEESVGCKKKCLFCQYTWTRCPLEEGVEYNPGQGMTCKETDWESITIDKAGHYITAWDGWNEETRRKVNKSISDSQIIEKLLSIDRNRIQGGIFLKIYQITGYPWETETSVSHDIEGIEMLLDIVDKQISTKMFISFCCTPFEASPMTPLECEPVNIDVNWREKIGKRMVFKGRNLTAEIGPWIFGPYAVYKQMLIQRATRDDINHFKAIAFSSRLKMIPERFKIPWMRKFGYVNEDKVGRIAKSAVEYLKLEEGRGAKISGDLFA